MKKLSIYLFFTFSLSTCIALHASHQAITASNVTETQNFILEKLNAEYPSLYSRDDLKYIPVPNTPHGIAEIVRWIATLDATHPGLDEVGKRKVTYNKSMNELLCALFKMPELNNPNLFNENFFRGVDLTPLTIADPTGITSLELLQRPKQQNGISVYEEFFRHYRICRSYQMSLEQLMKPVRQDVAPIAPAFALVTATYRTQETQTDDVEQPEQPSASALQPVSAPLKSRPDAKPIDFLRRLLAPKTKS